MNGFTRGMIGLTAGILGKRVLDIASPMNVIFLAAFSLVEAIVISLILQTFYGIIPFFGVVLTRMIPQALYTGLLGILLLRYINRKDVMSVLMRRSLLKE